MKNRRFKKLGGDFIEDLGEYVREYVCNHPGVSIYIGCDSDEVNASTLCYVSTICFYDELRKDGVHYIFSREFVDSKVFGNINIYVARNPSEVSDLIELSCCEHQILCYSTFGFIAAWLNQNPDKIVLIPERKYCFSGSHTNFIPDYFTELAC